MKERKPKGGEFAAQVLKSKQVKTKALCTIHLFLLENGDFQQRIFKKLYTLAYAFSFVLVKVIPSK